MALALDHLAQGVGRRAMTAAGIEVHQF